jgi:tetratricopeptide (TPR) repeat protein
MDLRMLHLFLTSEADPEDRADDPRYARYVARVRAAYERGGPEAARMPGIVWPLTVFQRRGAGLRELLDAAVANCRAHGGDWELGVALMLRTHMVVDSAGGLRGVDEDLAELRELSRRVGDRWMRAQVCSAAGEAAMARGRLAEAREEYGEALRLAHEVGAYTEAPFLIARLGEIAYRSGDRRAAEAALDEASEAADRHRVTDARAFVSLLRAFMALDERDTVRARELCGTTRAEISRGSPPPQFLAALDLLEALVTAAETGPEQALPMLARALRRAVGEHCAETVTAGLVDEAANLLGRLGDFPRAARLLAAGERLRGGLARALPERAESDRTEAAARTALGPERYAAECARGAALTMDEIIGELATSR